MSEKKHVKIFSKNLCKTCNLDGDCYCQHKSQKCTNDCGMDEVIEQNRKLRSRSQTYDNPEYVDFMNERR